MATKWQLQIQDTRQLILLYSHTQIELHGGLTSAAVLLNDSNSIID
ncbi:hypothetical protein FM038_25410 [Shewanella eurypsychrophilus]|uniref:Uncharacterized protein n=1 Tax=Shewanella eurypsychrophilus TaxID=2593656 RepID=A0ABX8S2M4_9GAMM|nr:MULTISPECIES: hypothetical protein [Shewanella]QXP44792.1 hypothetical protein FM038_25410 [Shewanella eurypsychrophilus]